MSDQSASWIRSVFALLAASVSTAASFGLILSLLWSLTFDSQSHKLITSIISAAIAITFGGFITAWISKRNGLILPFLFGLAFGSITFIYILGFEFRAIVFIVISSIATYAGGKVYHHLTRWRSTSGMMNQTGT